MKKSSDSGRHVSKRWSESVAFAVLNVALPQLAGNDIDPICGVSWIMAAHDSITDRRERLGQCALNGAQLRCCWQRDENESGGDERAALSATRPSRVMTDDSVDDYIRASTLPPS
jgi:hypothetical protein